MTHLVHSARATADDTDQLSLLYVDEDPDYLAFAETVLDGVDSVSVVVETDPSLALDVLDGVDCVVSDVPAASPDCVEHLDRVRERAPAIPFVVLTATPFDEVDEAFLARPATDYVRKEWDTATMTLLAHRAALLVDRQRTERSLDRFRDALETSREATLIAAPDGTVEYVNRRLQSELSRGRDELVGRPWTALFTEDAVRRLRSDALPVAAEGWNWSGECHLRTRTGRQLSARTSLVRRADGSLVFVFHGLDQVLDQAN